MPALISVCRQTERTFCEQNELALKGSPIRAGGQEAKRLLSRFSFFGSAACAEAPFKRLPLSGGYFRKNLRMMVSTMLSRMQVTTGK